MGGGGQEEVNHLFIEVVLSLISGPYYLEDGNLNTSAIQHFSITTTRWQTFPNYDRTCNDNSLLGTIFVLSNSNRIF